MLPGHQEGFLCSEYLYSLNIDRIVAANQCFVPSPHLHSCCGCWQLLGPAAREDKVPTVADGAETEERTKNGFKGFNVSTKKCSQGAATCCSKLLNQASLLYCHEQPGH